MLVISYHDGNAVKICKGCCDYRIQHFINTRGCIWTASIFPSSIPGTEADTCLDCLVIVGKSMHVSQAYWKDLSRKISCALQLFLPPSASPCPCWEDGGRAPPPLSVTPGTFLLHGWLSYMCRSSHFHASLLDIGGYSDNHLPVIKRVLFSFLTLGCPAFFFKLLIDVDTPSRETTPANSASERW